MKDKEIVSLLKKYSVGKMSKQEIVYSLENVEPIDLYFAEAELISDGFDKTELKKIAKVYLTVFSKISEDFYVALPDEHPLKVLMKEHKVLKGVLNKMDELSEDIGDELKEENSMILEQTLDNLYELDKHIRREESVIFPRLDKDKMHGRITLLNDEHVDFRRSRKKLEELLVEGQEVEDISNILDDIIYLLREHSFIENDLLYPVAYKKIEDWDDVAAESDRIGYCKFV